MALSFDHNIIDGAPAARFTERFTELIKSADALKELTGQASYDELWEC